MGCSGLASVRSGTVHRLAVGLPTRPVARSWASLAFFCWSVSDLRRLVGAASLYACRAWCTARSSRPVTPCVWRVSLRVVRSTDVDDARVCTPRQRFVPGVVMRRGVAVTVRLVVATRGGTPSTCCTARGCGRWTRVCAARSAVRRGRRFCCMRRDARRGWMRPRMRSWPACRSTTLTTSWTKPLGSSFLSEREVLPAAAFAGAGDLCCSARGRAAGPVSAQREAPARSRFGVRTRVVVLAACCWKRM